VERATVRPDFPADSLRSTFRGLAARLCHPGTQQLHAHAPYDAWRPAAFQEGSWQRESQRPFGTLQRRSISVVVVVIVAALAPVLLVYSAQPPPLLLYIVEVACVVRTVFRRLQVMPEPTIQGASAVRDLLSNFCARPKSKGITVCDGVPIAKPRTRSARPQGRWDPPA
jgi:hypothetical protein